MRRSEIPSSRDNNYDPEIDGDYCIPDICYENRFCQNKTCEFDKDFECKCHVLQYEVLDICKEKDNVNCEWNEDKLTVSCECDRGYYTPRNSSVCVTDYCYNINCNRGVCKRTSNGYRCECEPG